MRINDRGLILALMSILLVAISIFVTVQLFGASSVLDYSNISVINPRSSADNFISRVQTTEAVNANDLVIKIFEDVTNATGYRYCAHDDKNCGLDTIKIIENPAGGYLGIYHSYIGGAFHVRLAES